MAPQELLPVYTVELLWTVLSNVLPVNSSSVLLFHTDADKTKEDSFKFFYVTKGPSRAQGKKLFYMYGQGWTAKDSLQVKPTQTLEEGSDFAWPSRHGPNDLVYQIKIISSSEWHIEIFVAEWFPIPRFGVICAYIKGQRLGNDTFQLRSVQVLVCQIMNGIFLCMKTSTKIWQINSLWLIQQKKKPAQKYGRSTHCD